MNVFKKKEYRFQFYSFQEVNHEIAVIPQIEYREEILKFITDYVWNKKSNQMEFYIMDSKRNKDSKISLKKYMK